ncbi:hypothetical protein [Bradyrhizobium genosp. P]|uniref:hypothetical protein n=1 Tax=Bradyrhizobium genosp. P TaxID=83641 RepID=UPI003CF6D200
MADMSEPDDLVDEFYRPYVRALGNMVVLFAQCEADLLAFVSELCGGGDDAELGAVRLLKDEKAKDRIIELVRRMGLSGFDLDELVGGIDNFWSDKEARNRLIHDDWFPSVAEGQLGRVGTRGLTRKKVPEEVIGWPGVDEVWGLAHRFREYSSLFSHRAWELSRNRSPDSSRNDRPIGPA